MVTFTVAQRFTGHTTVEQSTGAVMSLLYVQLGSTLNVAVIVCTAPSEFKPVIEKLCGLAKGGFKTVDPPHSQLM